MRMLPSTPSVVVAVLAAALALALLAGGRTPHAESASEPCSAAAEAIPDSLEGALSSPLAIAIACDLDTDVVISAPGGSAATHHVEAGSPLLVEGERAYLCNGQAALVELSAPALDWFAAVPISALGALPRCDLLLKAGVTELRWSGPRAPLPGALASASLATAAPAARSIAGVVPGLSVWALHEDAPWSWTAWGDGVPPLLSGLDALVPGNDYLVVSDVERAWTFPRPTLQPSAFEDAQVVSFYGYPGIAVMGALGAYSPDRAAAELARWADRYDRLNGPRDVIPAFHLIVAVAQRTPQRDGSYLRRLSDEGIAEYVEAARDHSMLLFLDIQIGWSDPLAEVELLEPFLAEPFVHLALDPEFATGRFGERPGTVIGALDARQINAVQDYLAALVVEEGLPPKILVLHQFLQRMVRDRDAIAAVPEVELTIDMDGFGNDRLKLDKYDRFALAAPADRAAIKLFFDWDAPLISPNTLQALADPPDLIIYQ